MRDLSLLLDDKEIKKEWIESGLWQPDLIATLAREWPKGAREWKGKVDRFMRVDLVLIENKTDRLVGHLPLSFNKKDQSIEIGYFILGTRRKKGYATEAVQAIIDWNESLSAPQILYSWALERNRASRKLLASLDFKASPKRKIDGLVQRCYYRE